MELFNIDNVWGRESHRKNNICSIPGHHLSGDAKNLNGCVHDINGDISELSGCCSRIGGRADHILNFTHDLTDIQKLINKYRIRKIHFMRQDDVISILIYFHFSTRKLIYTVSRKENSLLQKLDHSLSIFVAKHRL